MDETRVSRTKWYEFYNGAQKAASGLVGVLVVLLAQNFIPDPWDDVASAVVAVATYLGIYATKNQRTDDHDL